MEGKFQYKYILPAISINDGSSLHVTSWTLLIRKGNHKHHKDVYDLYNFFGIQTEAQIFRKVISVIV